MGGMTDADPSHVRDESDDDGRSFGEPTIWDRAAGAFTRWRAGDSRAMDELVRVMTPVLWHVVRAYGLERSLAEDVVQNTWMTLIRRHDSIADDRAVAGWLTTCARREAWRSAKAHQRVRPVEDIDLEPHLPVEVSAEARAELADSEVRLWRAVKTLEERCRRLLRIVAFEERPDYARIAQDLSMPIGSIGPTRQRCLGKLRARLAADGWTGDADDR
jgi:RNA polymerase sigma factor, sigma-70 family